MSKQPTTGNLFLPMGGFSSPFGTPLNNPMRSSMGSSSSISPSTNVSTGSSSSLNNSTTGGASGTNTNTSTTNTTSSTLPSNKMGGLNGLLTGVPQTTSTGSVGNKLSGGTSSGTSSGTGPSTPPGPLGGVSAPPMAPPTLGQTPQMPYSALGPQHGMYYPYVAPQMAPMSRVPFLGASITLVSNNGIRYEGTLHSIDTENSRVALKDVKIFGTEGRREGEQVPAQDKIFELIRFNSADIQDLTVNQSPSPYQMYPMQGGYMPGYLSQPHGFMQPQGFMPPMHNGYFQYPTVSDKLNVMDSKSQKPVVSSQPSSSSTATSQPSSGQTSSTTAPLSGTPTTTTTTTTQPSAPSVAPQTAAPQTTPSTTTSTTEKTETGNETDVKEEKKRSVWNSKSFDDNKKKGPKFIDEDFDFAASTEKWSKEQDKKILEDIPSRPVYNKSSFFDNIEPEAKIHYDAKEAYKTDMETFGTALMNSHRNQRRSSSHRGGGRGGRGGNFKRRGGSGGFRGNSSRGRGGHPTSARD